MTELSREQKMDFLARMREARALVLRDAEAFSEAVRVLEYVGQVCRSLSPVADKKLSSGLGGYRAEILGLLPRDEQRLSGLFDVVKDARNDAVHDGAAARHWATGMIELLLAMESEIKNTITLAEHIMVRSPVVAEQWHPIVQLRRDMLANSFSCLPVLIARENGQAARWHLVEDVQVMRYSNKATSPEEKRKRTAMTFKEASAPAAPFRLEIRVAHCVSCDTPIYDLVMGKYEFPVLVTSDGSPEGRLLGLISAFDLL